MKAVQITLVLIVILALAGWVQDGNSFHIVRTLPLLGGHRPGIYDLAGFAMLLITLIGFVRLRRRRTGSDRSASVGDDAFEEYEEESLDEPDEE